MTQIRPSLDIAQEGAADGEALVWDDTAGQWVPGAVAGSGLSDPTTTKGDLIVRSATAPDRQPVGVDGYTLIADASQALGVRWGRAYPTAQQERLTASGGETTLTLGASPIGGKPQLWMGTSAPVLLWQGVDWTISGDVVTFTSPLTAGDVISVFYDTAGTSPPPSSLGGASAAPDDFAGLQLWLKPELITGLSNQDPVSTWADASGNANDLSASGSSRPTWESSPFVDGRPGVRFASASNQYMQAGDTSLLDLTGDLAIFVVVRFTTVSKGSTSQNTVVSKDYTRYELYEYQTLEASYVGGTANPANSASGVLAASTVYLLELHRASNALTIIRNAVQQGSSTNSASNTGTYKFTLGNRGSSLTAGNALNGDIFEVIVYDQARSGTDKTAIRNYIAGRWPSIGL